MHITGKILAWLAVIGCGAAVALTAKALDIRSQWMDVAQKREAEFLANEKQLQTREAEVRELRLELGRVNLGWNRYWNGVRTAVLDQDQGSLTVEGLGTNRGLAERQIVYAFAPNGDGTFTYVGDFKVTTAREDRAALEPNWRVRPGVAQSWRTGDWRIRSLIPAQHQVRFTNLEVELLIADELLTAQRDNVARQQQLTQVAEQHVQLRVGEINGLPDLEGKTLPPEISKGLLTVLADEEDTRNGVLLQVDDLLRKLRETNEGIDRLRALNAQLVASLPQPEDEPKVPVSAAGR